MESPGHQKYMLKITNYSRQYLYKSLLTLLIVGTISCSTTTENIKEDKRPNILLLVADDLGYADLGCYGGDIETPNIDKLASSGILFSRYHTSPLCAPTRAMLLSGNDNHIAGMGSQGLVTDEFGYEGRISTRTMIIPEVLKKAGYHTYMAGKWHLGMDSLANPFRRGFERVFANLGSSGNHYNNQGLFADDPLSVYTEDGKPADWETGKYSTDFFTDKLIEYINEDKADGKPFFAFAAYTSPHWPLQVDEEYWRKYEGKYNDGYEVLKERRLESLKRAGLVPENAVLPPNHTRVKPWSSLTDEEKKKESRKMELYAGMVDNLDYNIGRLIQHLKDIGEYDNTLILFMSDNGAAAEDFYYGDSYGPFIREHFTDAYESMGQPNSFISYGPQWAEASSSPFKYFKQQTTEGGIIAPMIISGPAIEEGGIIHHGLVTLMDVAPTFYEVAKAEYPETHNNKNLYPLKGNSIMPLATGIADKVHDDDYVFGLEHRNRAMIRKGDWKITNTTRPFDTANFELYNLSNDLAELNNLKESEPEKYQELLLEWTKFSEEIKVQVPTPTRKQ